MKVPLTVVDFLRRAELVHGDRIEAAYARKKLAEKNADMIVLNSLNDAGAGFGHDTNKIR